MPADTGAVIIRWSSLGGLRVAGTVQEPSLLVHADGRFSAPGRTPGGPRRTGQLSRQQLQELLTDVLLRQRFGSIEASDIQARIRAVAQVDGQGRVLLGMDGGVTHIEVDLPDVRHRVEWPGLHQAQSTYPEVEPLQRLFAVQRRLLALAATAR
ncbi:hypothetical protein [Sphaerotilus microaerophilus]|uniref:Uncharacterized protein n=1 Tax=Sphaerotilus microaerophilus TaxID=2914710 RepID=A0ABM7YRT4_9BURK|nr:hypothetical protein [Sphaerotilus sp. FB-5]BDI07319.1 hypothetical protein CATMQ487_42890 [Sphaerotilus sp. FB-5]